jgi:hypothetical protein
MWPITYFYFFSHSCPIVQETPSKASAGSVLGLYFYRVKNPKQMA